MSNVKLAVRVRPFTERELKSDKDRVPVVNVVDNNTISITNMKVSLSGAGDSRERVRRYYADYTLDSACPVTNPAYASQEKVFEKVGRDVLAKIISGSSACVLAYGQSATGKTHTMMGSDAQPGLVPRLCRALAEEQPFHVTISFLEIYNERVHDLLAGEEPSVAYHSLPRRRGNARKDLRVREHPAKGPYVQNLRRVAVSDVEALLALVSEGTRRRRTAATRRNSTSSRSHALLELITSRATLSLADLAGSENASWEGCGGGRQKEGANINKSLVALSNVISALVSGGGGRGRFVPYRDSALTWLLKDCFTGGACAFIIATVSPSFACYGESASTLRWAARARQLPTQKISNYGPSVTSRTALQTQLNQLLAELARHYIRYVPETGKISYDDNHWTLAVINKNNLKSDVLNTTTKIGNIMNKSFPKADAPNSESTPSSVASGSSEVINIMDKNINLTNEISKEVDKLFGPALERTRSGSDLEVIAPLRHKRRQYRSQEILPINESLHSSLNPNTSDSLLSQSQMQINDTQNIDKVKVPPVAIFYDNQRAEIVASVTERLYSKLKKKEESASSKMESIVDKKIMEPLSELRICSNARQRLMELSKKAMRNKRRIGIPAHTQTRSSVTRVRNQAIDVQEDLEPYAVKEKGSYTYYRDASTETIPMTSRCKEKAVGCGSLDFHDRSTVTESKQVIQKSSFAMTDDLGKRDHSTQTIVVPPPRRKKRASNILKHLKHHESTKTNEDYNSAPIISINISQTYSVDSESHSSDDNLEKGVRNTLSNNKNIASNIVTMTPDLLTDHNTVDTKLNKDDDINKVKVIKDTTKTLQKDNLTLQCEEFSESDDYTLPRVTVAGPSKIIREELKDIILGRNGNVYPYNIVLSPPRERDNTKKIVKFKDDDPVIPEASQTCWKWKNNDDMKNDTNAVITNSEKESNEDKCSYVTSSDSAESSKIKSFIWKRGDINQFHRTMGYMGKPYTPVYKSNSKYRTAKARLYKEFLGLDNEEDSLKHQSFPRLSADKEISSSDSADINDEIFHKFKQRRRNIEDQLACSRCDKRDIFENLERKILDSCDRLDVAVNNYDDYLARYRDNYCSKCDEPARTPTEYLHHLVNLRREVIKADSDTTESSYGIPRK